MDVEGQPEKKTLPADGTLATRSSATISAFPASSAARQNLAHFSGLRNGITNSLPRLKTGSKPAATGTLASLCFTVPILLQKSQIVRR
jgi:hypothetical protein